MASGSLRKSPVSSSSGDEVPHILIRKPRVRLGKISISSAKVALIGLGRDALDPKFDRSTKTTTLHYALVNVAVNA